MGPVRDAATVMLVRDRPDLHVFVLRRNPRVVFSPGATVFPGGAVDPADHAPEVAARVRGLDDADASAEHGLDANGLAFRVAAVRECFEESGILLARNARLSAALQPSSRFTSWRERMNARHVSFVAMLEAEDLVLDARDLRLFSHWLTPVGAPRRYNTWFFVSAAPDGQEGVHDDNELIESTWIRPTDALRAHREGDIDLILPTQRSLEMLARYTTVAALLAELPPVGAQPAVVTDLSGERVALRHEGSIGTARRGWTNPLPDITVDRETRIAREGVA